MFPLYSMSDRRWTPQPSQIRPPPPGTLSGGWIAESLKRKRVPAKVAYNLRRTDTIDIATVCSGTDSFALGASLVSASFG